jgi:hypothetical protein
MIPVSQYLIQSCIEQLELALENQVDRHCGVYICFTQTYTHPPTPILIESH